MPRVLVYVAGYLSLAYWRFVSRWHRRRAPDGWCANAAMHRGYRRALGGRWGKWETKLLGRWSPMMMWWPSGCEHYPPPPLVNSTEPLETEDYTESHQSLHR
jgi:hypothetical protein